MGAKSRQYYRYCRFRGGPRGPRLPPPPPPLFFFFSTTNITFLLWKLFSKMLFSSIFRNVNVTLLRMTNTPTMLYAACPEKWSFHSGRGGWGGGGNSAPFFLNFFWYAFLFYFSSSTSFTVISSSNLSWKQLTFYHNCTFFFISSSASIRHESCNLNAVKRDIPKRSNPNYCIVSFILPINHPISVT